MPAAIGVLEQNASVADHLGWNDPLEVIDVRGGPMAESTTVIEDERLPDPALVPVVIGVQIEDVRAQLHSASKRADSEQPIGV